MTQTTPNTGMQIRSTLKEDGTVQIELVTAGVASPADDQVVVRVEAAPINPSDLMMLLAGANPTDSRFASPGEQPLMLGRIPAAAARLAASRLGKPLAIGLEGAGVVVAAGKNATDLLGRNVAVMSLSAGTFGQYCTVGRTDCMPLPDGVPVRDGAAFFTNPLTALAMVETLHQTGQRALVNNAAASNLGQMLVRICQEDRIPLVNIVRREEHVDILRAMGADYVCNSSAPSFSEDLVRALKATGAMVAFDAIGGGTMASELLVAMETVALDRSDSFQPYGSSEDKRIYIYGRLDPGAIVLPPRAYGLTWGVEGWSMPPILKKAGPERTAELAQRIVRTLTTTFKSHYAREISLAEALSQDVMIDYCAKSTGKKYLINPWL